MTRINCGIHPTKLTRQHLIAEHREIKRIPNVIVKGNYSLDGQPKEFKLGTGHVKFFYDKLLYLRNRYESIYTECVARGFNVTYYGDAWNGVPQELMNDYIPTLRDAEIVEERIKERLSNGKN